MALVVKNPPANAGDLRDKGSIPGSGRSPGRGHGNPLLYSCWRIPWTKEPGGLQSIGSQRVRHDWSDSAGSRQAYTYTDWKDMYEDQDFKDNYLTSSSIRLARCYSPSLPLTQKPCSLGLGISFALAHKGQYLFRAVGLLGFIDLCSCHFQKQK